MIKVDEEYIKKSASNFVDKLMENFILSTKSADYYEDGYKNGFYDALNLLLDEREFVYEDEIVSVEGRPIKCPDDGSSFDLSKYLNTKDYIIKNTEYIPEENLLRFIYVDKNGENAIDIPLNKINLTI